MIDTLINHLDSSFTYPDKIVNNTGTVTLYERALRGELYLEKGDYENAVKYLTNAIGDDDIKRFKVEEKYKDENWKNIFIYTSGQLTEVMSTILYSYQDNQENPLSYIFYANRNYLVKPTDYIIDLFDSQITVQGDTGDLYRGEGVSYIYSGPGKKLMVNKYSIDPIESSGADIIIYRAADLHLLLAEALNQIGQYQDALKIINDGAKDFKGWNKNLGIRGRAGLTLKAMPTENIKDAIEDIIMEERALELAFEGKRWFDLVRVANRRGASYLAEKVAAKYQDTVIASTVRNKLMDKNNWYLPFRK
jgi:starch-binding outer membrane protein, SusD/RagB family